MYFLRHDMLSKYFDKILITRDNFYLKYKN